MEDTYWLKQTNIPLFKELEWNKPERRDQAGKLLIIGGNQHNLGAPATAFDIVKLSGLGGVQVALPDKTKRLIGHTLPQALFLPSTSSGEFAINSEPELINHAMWADTLLLPGDNGRNSQTAILFEALLRSYKGHIVATRDAVDLLSNSPKLLLERNDTTLVVSFAQLQRLLRRYEYMMPLTFAMDLVPLVTALHQLTSAVAASVAVLHQHQIIIAAAGQISTTKLTPSDNPPPWRLQMAAQAACYQTWYPKQRFQALTQAAYLTQRAL